MKLAAPDDTTRAGAFLAAHVRGGDAIALVGDLGAGKTTFTAGLVAHAFDARFPFFIGATALLIASGYLAAMAVARPGLGNS